MPDFYYELQFNIIFSLRIFIVFILILLFHTFSCIYLLFALFIRHLSKIADWQSKARFNFFFSFLTRGRFKKDIILNTASIGMLMGCIEFCKKKKNVKTTSII